MEHNFVFNSSAEITLIRDILAPIFNDFATYQSMRGIVNFGGMSMPDVNNFSDVSIKDLLDRLDTALAKATEDEKPKYEHRYAVRDKDGETIREYDKLEDAWSAYEEAYQNDYECSMCVDEGDYEIFDNKLQLTVTSAVPFNEHEYHYSINLDVELDGGDSIDASDVPSSVMEDIIECFSCGDDYGYVYDNVGDVGWDDIADWESDHEEAKDEVAEPMPTEPETVTEPDNTWHIY